MPLRLLPRKLNNEVTRCVKHMLVGGSSLSLHDLTKAKMISKRFMAAIQEYQKVEQQYRTKYKQRVERQFKIGN
jgi:t-SNARE complex subunit (syntaxin)